MQESLVFFWKPDLTEPKRISPKNVRRITHANNISTEQTDGTIPVICRSAQGEGAVLHGPRL